MYRTSNNVLMNHLLLNRSKKHGVTVLLLVLLVFPGLCGAEERDFRKQFITNYKTFQFGAQEKLVKGTSAQLMQAEIRTLVDEAMTTNQDYTDKLYMLDVANAMASAYQHWHGDIKALTKEIEKLIKAELKQEEIRVAKLMRWKKEERFLGNFVMKDHMAEMEKAGVSPVIYPHWVHRIWFECKVCHQDIFVMNRWRNKVSHQKIESGKQCGVCHDGKIAFGVKDKGQCTKCHIAGKPEAEKLHHTDKIDHARIKQVAEQVGAEWNIENLPEGKIPVDKFGFINWLTLKENGVFKPIHSLREGFAHEVRDNKILFKSKGKIDDVIFDHKVHSNWINCSSCHPEIFRETTTNDVKMIRMSKGKFCGYCHGKVSFTFADCKRCHKQEKGAGKAGVIIHQGAAQ